jgi:hypothetical protein
MKTIFLNKNMICSFLAILTIFQLATSNVSAQDANSRTDEYTIRLNKLGDAQIEVSEKMTESQWQYFKQSPLMTDVSIAKRNMESSMSAYVIEDFKRDIDEVNRIAKMSFTIKAESQYDGNGSWEVKTEYKNPHVEKLTDKEYMMTDNFSDGGEIVNENIKVFFPDGAKDVQQTTDEFGKTKFTYKLSGGTTSYMSWNNILGVLLILSAIFFFVRKPQTEHIPPPLK